MIRWRGRQDPVARGKQSVPRHKCMIYQRPRRCKQEGKWTWKSPKRRALRLGSSVPKASRVKMTCVWQHGREYQPHRRTCGHHSLRDHTRNDVLTPNTVLVNRVYAIYENDGI